MLVKLGVYCPVNTADKLRKVMFSAGAGRISDYSNCSFNISGKGTFKPGINSKPYVGKIGETHQEDEIKIEVILLRNLLDSVLEQVKKHHPYEEVAYDVYSLENTSDIGSGLIGELENEIDAVDFLKTLKVKMNTQNDKGIPEFVKIKSRKWRCAGGLVVFYLVRQLI